MHAKVVTELRRRGYAIDLVNEIARGADDAALLDRADMAAYVFITNDRDFGRLIFQDALSAPLAILYTRTAHRDWLRTADLLAVELERGVQAGQIATITERGVRRRAFPARSD